MAKKQPKPERVIGNAYKYFDSIDDDSLQDPSYIPEHIQPYISQVIRKDRASFDILERRLNLADKDSDDYIGALRAREGIAKKFITIRKQIDLFNKRTKSVKDVIPNINRATTEENAYVNLAVHGNQWDSFHIDEDGKFHFGLEVEMSPSKLNFFKFEDIQDNNPIITEPFKEKVNILKLANITKSKRDKGAPFDWKWTYDQILYNLNDTGSDVVMGLAFTDIAGDGRTKSFAEQWDEGLIDETLYLDDNGEQIVNSDGQPLTSEDMKNPEYMKVTSEVFSKYMTNVMAEIGGVTAADSYMNTGEGDVRDSGGMLAGKMGASREGSGRYGAAPNRIGNTFKNLDVELPTPEAGEVKSRKSIANTELNEEVNSYLRQTPENPKPASEKVKTMPPKLYNYYTKRIRELAKLAKKDGSAEKHWELSLPGGDYYSLLRQIHEWRRKDLTPAELVKKYSNQ